MYIKENYIIKINNVVVVDGDYKVCEEYINNNVGDVVLYKGEEISIGDCMESCYVEGENLNINIINKNNVEINLLIIIY